ncbi:MAG: glutamine amidotransferase, partial [Solirubrobacterales bacterium]
MTERVRLLTLYPDELNIYADRGNLLFLRKRCEWRGIEFESIEARPGESFSPGDADLIYIGGGQDRDQEAVGFDLLETKGEAVTAFVEMGKPLLAVCGGFQLLGRTWSSGDGEEREGRSVVASSSARGGGGGVVGAGARATGGREGGVGGAG